MVEEPGKCFPMDMGKDPVIAPDGYGGNGIPQQVGDKQGPYPFFEFVEPDAGIPLILQLGEK